MKKILIILALSIVVTMTACNSNSKTIKNPQSFVVSSLIQKDGTYTWPTTEWKSSINDVESQSGLQFPDIPYMSAEWVMVPIGETPDEFFDYRNDDNYDSVEYLAYVNGEPLQLQYGNYTGYISFEFKQGQLSFITIYFGTGTSTRDPKMTFEGTNNDTDAILSKLREDLVHELGEPTNSTVSQQEYGSTIESWQSNVSSDSYQTVISISRLPSEMDCVYLMIGTANLN